MIDLQKMANEILSDFSWTSKSDGDPFRTIFRVLRDAYEAGRKDENEECAKVVEAFIHTRSDCERGTTTQEIAQDVRARMNATPNAEIPKETK